MSVPTPCPAGRRLRAVLPLAALATAAATSLASGPASAAPARATAAPTASRAGTSQATAAPARAVPAANPRLRAAAKLSGQALSPAAQKPRVTARTPAAQAAAVGPELLRGHTLAAGQSLQSPGGRYSLVMGTDGALTYQEAPNRLNPEPVSFMLAPQAPAGSRLVLQTDGNLVLYSPTDVPVYSLGTNGSTAQRLVIQDDSNLVLYGTDGAVVYNYGFPELPFLEVGEVLLPGDRVNGLDGSILVMQTDGNLVLYTGGRAVFSSNTAGQGGAAAILQSDGNFVVYSNADPPVALFSTGTFGHDDQDVVLDMTVAEFKIIGVGAGNSSLVSLYGSAWATPTLTSGQFLFPGDRRTSPGRACLLLLQTDGNLVDYCGGRAVFATRSSGDALAYMDPSGEFYVLEVQGENVTVAFTTRTDRFPGSRLTVQDDRNLVVYTPQGRPVFAIRR